MSYTLEFLEEAKRDLVGLDREVQLAGLRVARELRDDPWLGEPLRSRARVGDLTACRRVRFDRPDWPGRPRYRLIYRNHPEDGSIAVVKVIAADLREQLDACKTAAARLRRELRRQLGSSGTAS